MHSQIEFIQKMLQAYDNQCRPLCHKLNIPQTALDILLFLSNNPEYTTARDIVEIRKIKANLVSINVDKLVREGYLERRNMSTDRRKVQLVVTKKAEEIVREGRRVQREFKKNIFAHIDEESLNTLSVIMEQMERNMEQMVQKGQKI